MCKVLTCFTPLPACHCTRLKAHTFSETDQFSRFLGLWSPAFPACTASGPRHPPVSGRPDRHASSVPFAFAKALPAAYLHMKVLPQPLCLQPNTTSFVLAPKGAFYSFIRECLSNLCWTPGVVGWSRKLNSWTPPFVWDLPSYTVFSLSCHCISWTMPS